MAKTDKAAKTAPKKTAKTAKPVKKVVAKAAKKPAKKAAVASKKKAKAETTHITLLIDRSASMSSIAREMETGINNYVADQAKLPGKCLVTALHFDTVVEHTHTKVDINALPKIAIFPRGSTALYDAIAHGIAIAKTVTDATKQVFVVITDGEENASKEVRSGAAVAALITAQTDWAFIFLGANQDAIATATSMGISANNAMNYTATADSVARTSSVLASATRGYRSGALTNHSLFEKSQQHQ